MVLVTSAMGKVGHVVATVLAKQGFDVRATDINPRWKPCSTRASRKL